MRASLHNVLSQRSLSVFSETCQVGSAWIGNNSVLLRKKTKNGQNVVYLGKMWIFVIIYLCDHQKFYS